MRVARHPMQRSSLHHPRLARMVKATSGGRTLRPRAQEERSEGAERPPDALREFSSVWRSARTTVAERDSCRRFERVYQEVRRLCAKDSSTSWSGTWTSPPLQRGPSSRIPGDLPPPARGL